MIKNPIGPNDQYIIILFCFEIICINMKKQINQFMNASLKTYEGFS